MSDISKKIEEFYAMVSDISENPSASIEKKKEQLDSLLVILKDYANFMDNVIKAKMIDIISDEMDIKYGMWALKEQEKDFEFNTALGHYTLGSNTTGDNNIAIGYGSEYKNIDGNGNVAIGNWTLYFNEHGHHNLAFGYSAGQRLKGNYNIAFGKESLFNAQGDDNLALGKNAGMNLKNGDNNIYIGKTSGNANENNKLYIGNKISGHSMIEGDMEAKEMKLNVSKLNIADLPTSADNLEPGDIWNDNGTLKIVV